MHFKRASKKDVCSKVFVVVPVITAGGGQAIAAPVPVKQKNYCIGSMKTQRKELRLKLGQTTHCYCLKGVLNIKVYHLQMYTMMYSPNVQYILIKL